MFMCVCICVSIFTWYIYKCVYLLAYRNDLYAICKWVSSKILKYVFHACMHTHIYIYIYIFLLLSILAFLCISSYKFKSFWNCSCIYIHAFYLYPCLYLHHCLFVGVYRQTGILNLYRCLYLNVDSELYLNLKLHTDIYIAYL